MKNLVIITIIVSFGCMPAPALPTAANGDVHLPCGQKLVTYTDVANRGAKVIFRPFRENEPPEIYTVSSLYRNLDFRIHETNCPQR
jgi:hypothetical protein